VSRVGIDLVLYARLVILGYSQSHVFDAGFVGKPLWLYVCAIWPDLGWHSIFMRLVLVLFHVQDKNI
jgi:hypothetical protein